MKYFQLAALHPLDKPHQSSYSTPGSMLGLDAAVDDRGGTSPPLYTTTLPLICFICFGVQRNGWGRQTLAVHPTS